MQPVYLVQQQPQQQPPVMQHQYQAAVVGVPVGSPVPQAMAIQGYGGAQGWAYRPAMVEPPREPVWGYGDRPRGYGEQHPQEPRVASNWQRAPPQGYGGSGVGGFQGRVEGHGSGGGGFQGRGEAHGNGGGGFQGRGEAHGNGGGGFQGRGEAHGNGQAFGKAGGEGRRPERGFESSSGSRHYSSGGPGRQHMNRQGGPPQSPAP
jgi:hypothetical protein